MKVRSRIASERWNAMRKSWEEAVSGVVLPRDKPFPVFERALTDIVKSRYITKEIVDVSERH